MNLKKLGQEIRKTRKLKLLSIEKASKLMGISYATLWKLEAGVATSISNRVKSSVFDFIGQKTVKTKNTILRKPIERTRINYKTVLSSINEIEILMSKIKRDFVKSYSPASESLSNS